MTFELAIESDVTRIKEILLERKETVATAESCTSGLLAYGLTSIAGSSDYFKQGWVVYQTLSKRTELCLPKGIEIYSPECAKHLAIACKTKAGTEYGIGVTGKADPYNGIVWFSVSHPASNTPNWTVRKYQGDRNQIRTKVAADIIRYFKVILLKQK